ncbi:MAG: acetyl-CoA carboxylase biotin carboxyl carrier protein [Alphaproteobacteria bacterium]
MPAFDVDADMIRRLAGLIDETGLTEIEWEDGQRRIRVARTAAAIASMPSVAVPVATVAQPQPGSAAPDGAHPGAVTSPMVGTAYLGSEPSAPPFVKVGDTVAKGDTLLIIEAMKVMNQIPAPRAGTVKQILVANGAPVEFGELLMIVE